MKISSLKDKNGDEIEIVPRKLCDANGNIIESNNLATKSELNEKANVKNSVYYVPGTSEYAAWKANTAYVVGANVVNQSGECWTCKTAHTSGSSWSSTNWNRISTVALTGSIDGVTTLYEGLTIAYRFQVLGGQSATTLNINNLGAKPIARGTDPFVRWTMNRNSVAVLVYDGSVWRFHDNVYTINDATCTTAGGTQAKSATSVDFDFGRHKNIPFRIYFANANTYSGSLTLNVNSQGAINLWINGSASSSSNMTIASGVYWCYYDGTQFQLWTDKSLWALKYRGDGSALTETFTAASSRANIATGESHATLFGKIAKWFGDLKALAFKDKVSDSDISGTISDSHIASAKTWNGKADKSTTVSTVAWDSTNKKLTKTINGATTDVVAASTLKTAMDLDKVANKTITVTSSSVSDGSTTFNKYTHPTTAGNKHIPSGGGTGKFLAWSADGTATWADNPASGKAESTHTHSASDITSGTLPISKGGTGETTARGIVSNTIQSGLSVGDSNLTDNTDIITTHSHFGYTSEQKDLYRRKAILLWNYIQSKISSVLGLTKDAYGGTATKATQDGSGNNIVNTYATKTELQDSNDEWANATTSLDNGKLNVDGSNASSKTTYNVLNAAAGGADYDINNDEEIILTHPTGKVAYKRTLEKFSEWITSIINRRLNYWYGNEQEVVFDNVKVRQGINNAEIEVATKFQVSREYEQIGNVKKIRAIEDKASDFGGEDLNSRIAVEHTNSGNYPSVFYYNMKGEGLNGSPSTGALPSDAHVFTMNWYNGTKGYIAQIAFSHNADKMWTRNKWGSSASWTDWKLMASASDSSTSEIKRYSGSSSVDYSYVGKVIVCKPSNYSKDTSKSVSSWIGLCVPSTMITHGQSFILVNTSNVTYTITGLANGSYSLVSNTALTIVYLDGNYYRQSV
jgi:hypothetical protein